MDNPDQLERVTQLMDRQLSAVGWYCATSDSLGSRSLAKRLFTIRLAWLLCISNSRARENERLIKQARRTE